MRRGVLLASLAVTGLLATAAAPAHADTVTPNCSPAPTDCSAAWYGQSVNLTWTFDPNPPDSTDCVPVTINETTSAGQEVSCSATWGADTQPGDVTIHVDLTNPSVDGATPDVSPNGAGWFNQPVSWDFFGSDALSGLNGSCSQGVSYSGPDSATASVPGSCTDNAGNVGNGNKTFKYDATPPVDSGATFDRPPNANGWYTQPVGWTIDGTDATSGIAPSSCTSGTYSGPDDGSAEVSGTCSDNAGNTGSTAHQPLQYDATAPTTTGVTLDRAPDHNGWYNAPVTADFHGTDALPGSNVSDPCATAAYSEPDAVGAHIVGDCHDNAGNTDPVPYSTGPFNYDATPPTVLGAAADRPPDSNGWYNHPVGLAFQGSDATSSVASCSSQVYGGPDSNGATVGGSCQDNAGNTGFGATSVPYDATPPRVLGVVPDRAPDHNGWYNHPVRLTFRGADGMSGIASCSHYAYDGPQSSQTRAPGTCTDAAGNSATGSFSMRYDATPPTPAVISAAPQNRKVRLTWTKPPDAVQVRVTRSRSARASGRKAIYSGKGTSFVDKHLHNGTRYTYTVTLIDQAGNQSASSVTVAPTTLTLRPLPGAVVGLPPKLTWKKVRRARYYNVQLYLGRTKVLSTWPKTASFQIPPSWVFAGQAYRLVPATYTWYVWPGIGPRSKNRYGHLLGKSSFTVLG